MGLNRLAAAIFKTAAAPSPYLKVGVIVPVRNEADHLWQTLDALRLQTDEAVYPIPHGLYEVLVLVNNCTDDSYSIALKYQQQYPDFRLHINYIDLAPAWLLPVKCISKPGVYQVISIRSSKQVIFIDNNTCKIHSVAN